MRFLGIILRVPRLEVSVYNFLHYKYKPILNHYCSGGGGVPLIKMTVNSKEENSEDFCPNYVQELGLWIKGRQEKEKGGIRIKTQK